MAELKSMIPQADTFTRSAIGAMIVGVGGRDRHPDDVIVVTHKRVLALLNPPTPVLEAPVSATRARCSVGGERA